MKTTLDCIPCFIRQALDAAKIITDDAGAQENILREVLAWTAEVDLTQSPPQMAQRIYRQLGIISGVADPYKDIKTRMNQIALEMLPALREKIRQAEDPLYTAARQAIAGNVIDFGVRGDISLEDVRAAIDQAFEAPFYGEYAQFNQALQAAETVLYLADNAGEIMFDRLLVEQLLSKKLTLAVRGAPVINDCTLADAAAAGLDKLVPVIDNGSDAPGTILSDCSEEFLAHYHKADLIIAKGQGNFESLSDEVENIWFLFMVKCPIVADISRQPTGTHMLVQNSRSKGR